MRHRTPVVLLFACGLPLAASATQQVQNPNIDMQQFLRVSVQAADWRQLRRVGEADFIRMSREPGTVVLDARSAEKYAELHVRGAINLPFPDIAVERLRQQIPDRDTRILIYCNNNFRNAQAPFPTKLPEAALNLSTYVSLYSYGYRNVYELGPQLDPATSLLEFESGVPD